MDTINDPDSNKIMNLIRFNSNFTKYVNTMKLELQSPEYVLEKYNHWVGFQPTIKPRRETPDRLVSFLSEYCRTWKPNLETFGKIKNILIYLKLTENMKFIDMFNRFNEYIGPFSWINPNPMRGLNEVIERSMVELVTKNNEEDIKVVLRDLRLGNLICDQSIGTHGE